MQPSKHKLISEKIIWPHRKIGRCVLLSKYCHRPAGWPQKHQPLSLSLFPQLCNEGLGSITPKAALDPSSPRVGHFKILCYFAVPGLFQSCDLTGRQIFNEAYSWLNP